MTILQALKKHLIGKEIELYQLLDNKECFKYTPLYINNPVAVKVTVTDVVYIEPYGDYEIEGGDYFNLVFAEGTAMLDNY